MGFSDSPTKSIFLTPEKKTDPQHHNNLNKQCKKLVKELFENSPENERLVSRFDDRRNDAAEEAAGAELKLMPAAAEEFSTPTGLAQKSLPSLVCPPAPRKPKSVLMPPSNMMSCRKRVFLDLTNDVNSLFPAAVRADFGNKIKKVRN